MKLKTEQRRKGKPMKPKTDSLKRSVKLVSIQQDWKRNDRIQITNIKNERRVITAGPTGIERVWREYYEQLCAHKLDNLGEMD